MVRAGARRIVVVRWLTESGDPGKAARELALALEAAIARAEG